MGTNQASYKEGSVRVDLLGGTLDLNPINLILPNVVTLNLATSLKAKVRVKTIDFDGVEIISKDYNSTDRFSSKEINQENLQNNYFKNLTFIVHLLNLFSLKKNISLELESGSPPGAGLGGSSAMGVTCYAALADYVGEKVDRELAIKKVNSIEAKILDCGPAGYQDYYPALFGGVLALHPDVSGVKVEQVYSEELKRALESQLTLVYSGDTRLSGINNWEVYKAFFNKDQEVRNGLSRIADLSQLSYEAIKNKKFNELSDLIKNEGDERRKLFPGILTPKMTELHQELSKMGHGLKVCGAGGGGCFLITHSSKNDQSLIESLLTKYAMKKLEFVVEKPI